MGGINPITNGDFSDGYNYWTAVQDEVIFGNNLPGTDIATPENSQIHYPSNSDGDDDDVLSQANTWQVDVISGRLRLQERRMFVSSFGIVHGPAIYSDLFNVDGGGNLLFDWEANYINDDYHVTGYLVDDSNNITIALGDATKDFDNNWGTTGSGEGSVTVPETGNYRFVFISGTFDRTGGRLAGASMYIDNVRVEDAMILDPVVESIIEKIIFSNTSDVPSETKTISITIEDYEEKSATTTAELTLTPVNDVPISDEVDGVGDEAGTITVALTAFDVDDTDPNDFSFTILTQPAYMSGSIDETANITYNSGAFTKIVTYTHDDSQNHNDDFTYRANDGEDDSEIATATITVTPINDAPISTDVNSSGSESNIITTTLTATDVDNTDTNDFEFIILSEPNYIDGNVSVDSYTYTSGTFSATATYTHDGSEHPSDPTNTNTYTDTFTFKANDGATDSPGALESDVHTATITITPVNDAPETPDVSGSGNEGQTITTTLTATDVDNDCDNNPCDVSFIIVDNPDYITGSVSIGTVTYSSNTFSADATYTHDDSQTISDSFTYKANDGNTDSNISTATITITPINDAPITSDLSGSGLERDTNDNNPDGVIEITLTATDVDDDDNPLDLTFNVSSANNGTIDESAPVTYSSGTFSKTIVYTHDGSNTTSDTFEYSANDGSLDSDDNDDSDANTTSTVNLTITPVNDPPVIPSNPSDATVDEKDINDNDPDGVVNITLTATDSDDDDSPLDLTFDIINDPDYGSISISNYQYSTGDPATFTATATYTHDGSENFSDSFTFQANDGSDMSLEVGTASISINEVNDPPTIPDDLIASANVTEGNGETRQLTLTANDVDNSNTSNFSFTIVDDPSYGSVSIDGSSLSYSSGTFTATATYTHDGSEESSDTFTYKANDGEPSTAPTSQDSETETATITVTAVNDPPIISDPNDSISATVDEGTSTVNGTDVVITLTATDVDDDDSPFDFTFEVVSNPTYGTVSIDANSYAYSSGTFTANATYTHDGSETTSDSFTFRANDGDNTSTGLGTASLTINAKNDSPFASDVDGSGKNNQVLTTTLIATDVDDDDSPLDLTFEIVTDPTCIQDGTSIDLSSNSVTYNSGTFSQVVTYQHNNDTNCTIDTFTYKANDGEGDGTEYSNVATATISIDENDAPETTDLTGSGNERDVNPTDPDSNDPDGIITILLKARDLNDDADDIANFSFSIVDPPSYIKDESADGNINQSDFDMSASLAYVNGNCTSNTCDNTTIEGLSCSDSADCDIYTQQITYYHDGSESTSDSFTYKANDGKDNSNTSTVNITITAQNDAPIASTLEDNVSEGETIEIILTATDVDDTDVSAFSFSIIDQPIHNINDDAINITSKSYSSGTFTAIATYIHDGSETTSDSFTYKANDGDSDSIEDTAGDGDNISNAIINIIPINDPPTLTSGFSNIIVDDTYDADGYTIEGGTKQITLKADDVDSDDVENFTFILMGGPTYGSVSIGSITYDSGTFTAIATYTHDGTEPVSPADEDSFSFKAYDGTDYSNALGNVILENIQESNDPPIVEDILGSGLEGGTITTVLSATDFEAGANTSADAISFEIASKDNEIGNITISSTSKTSSAPYIFTATATYTHNADEDPIDTFTYRAIDWGAPCSMAEYTDQSNCESNSGVWDPNLSAPLSSDMPKTATITITPVNDIPLVNNDSGLFTDYETMIGSGDEGFTINTTIKAFDPDITPTESITFQIINDPIYKTANALSIESVEYDPNSKIFSAEVSYVHDSSENHSDSFTFRANDGESDSDVETVNITINPINDPPIPLNVNGSGAEDNTITTILSATDVDDTNANDFTFTIVDYPSHYVDNTFQIASYNYSAGTFTAVATYTHNGDENPDDPYSFDDYIADTFTYKANDGEDDSNNPITGTATITVTPVNDIPQISNQTLDLVGFEDSTYTLQVEIYDPDTQNHTLTATNLGNNLITTIENESMDLLVNTENPTISNSIEENWYGIEDISFHIQELSTDQLSSNKSFTLTLQEVNDPPTKVVLSSPSDLTQALRIDSSNIYTNSIDLDWEPSTDVDIKDVLTYNFYSFIDNSNQNPDYGIQEPILLQEKLIDYTDFSIDYLDIYEKLDFKNNIWDETPNIKWTVTVWDSSVYIPTDTFTIVLPVDKDINLSINKLFVPTQYNLYQNYPNPFNPSTRINYDLPSSNLVRLTIFNLRGQEIITLVNDFQSPGRYSILWEGLDKYNRMVSSGVYFYHLSTSDYTKTKKMILIK